MNTITDFANLHKGKRVFILASGPSLSDLDLTPLQRRLTIGLNRSFLAWPNTHYHCAFDHRLFELFPNGLQAARYLFTLENRPWGIPLHLLGAEGFSNDLNHGIYSGYTIAFFALQVAVHLGFEEIIYLGLDLCHRSGNTHFFGQDWHSRHHEDTEFPKMIRSFTTYVPRLEQRGIKVWNCSPTADLSAIPFLSYEDAIAL